MKNFLTRALVALFCLAPVPVFAQAMVVTTCGTLNQNYTAGATRQATVDVTGKLCTNVTGAAGGTSATDNSVFTTGTTSVTPSGALYNDAATATSGNIAAPRMTSKRAQIVDVDTTGNALYTALTASVPACAASPCTTVIGAVVGYQGTTALSATNGWYFNQLQGNAALSATNPSFARPTDGTRAAIIDPCEANLQSYAPISITTNTTTRIVAPSASNKTYICALFLTSAAADNVGIVEGTGGTCGTGTAGVVGGTTAANGPNFAANGGVMMQAGGKVAVAQTAGTNVDLCLITSAATPLAGGIKYVQAP